jgi:L-arabinokinase
VTVVFYISGHGFGHASRAIEVINALLAHPGVQVHVRTSVVRWLFDLTVKGSFTYDSLETDTGIVQTDSLHLDEEASVRRALAFMATFEERAEREAEALGKLAPALVVADMPALGIAAAARAGIPVAALGNFTWDWAYSAYRDTAPLVEQIAAVYAGANLALRLPMWGGFGAFKRIVDLPFVARHSTRDPADTRRAIGVPRDKRLVLPSFGGHGLEGLQDAVKGLDGSTSLGAGSYEVLVDFDEKKLYADGFRYEDLVRAADVVVTKPGYGIIAECLANDTALLYTDRGNFIEYDVLAANIPRFLRARFISHTDLFAGRWQEHLDRLLAQPPPPLRPATNGAAVAANLLLDLAG